MNPNTRWQFNPFDQAQPLKKHESKVQPGLPRAQSLTELQGPQSNPVDMFLFVCFYVSSK